MIYFDNYCANILFLNFSEGVKDLVVLFYGLEPYYMHKLKMLGKYPF